MTKLKFVLILLFLYSESIAQQNAGFNFLLNGIVLQDYGMKLKGVGIGADFDVSVMKRFEINFGTTISNLKGIRINPIDTTYHDAMPNGTTYRYFYTKRELTELSVPVSLRFKIIDREKVSLKVSYGFGIKYFLNQHLNGKFYKPPTYHTPLIDMGPFEDSRNDKEFHRLFLIQEFIRLLSMEFAIKTPKENQIFVRTTFTMNPESPKEYGAMLSAGFRLNN